VRAKHHAVLQPRLIGIHLSSSKQAAPARLAFS